MVRRRGRSLIALTSLALVVSCAAPRVTVMPLREIPADQQARDRADCERAAGHPDVTRPVSGALQGKVLGALAGALLGAALAPAGVQSSNDPGEFALYVGISAGVGAAVGLVAGTLAGARAGVRAAQDEYLSRYTACMRERGYAVFRETR